MDQQQVLEMLVELCEDEIIVGEEWNTPNRIAGKLAERQ